MANCPDAAQHPGNNYYVNLETGAIQQQNSLLGHVIGLAGYWGPMDWCQAKSFAANYTASGALSGSAESHAAGSLLGSFFGGTSTGWLLRTAEILLGLALITVALAKLAGGTTAGQAATRAGKAAMIL